MSVSTAQQRLIHSSVRPARILVLVPKSMNWWQQTMLLLAELQSLLWSGRWNIAVAPVGTNHRIPEPFAQLVEAFDPDYAVKFGPTLLSLQEREIPHPAVNVIRNGLEQAGLFDDETFQHHLGMEVATWPETEGPVAEQVEAELPVFDLFLTEGVLQRIPATGDPGYPLTALNPYLQPRRNLPPIADFSIGSDGLEERLIAAWTLGLLSDELRDTWRAGGGELLEIPLFGQGREFESLDLVWGSASSG